jgi:hypothetical protein
VVPQPFSQAKAIKRTLDVCESKPIVEVKFCATSLESMVDSVRAIFGLQAARAKITRRRRSPTERSMLVSTERDREKRGRRKKKEEEDAQHTLQDLSSSAATY